MARRRSEFEVAVERDLQDPDGVVRRYRLVARYPSGESDPSPEELALLFRSLSEELDRSLPAGAPVSPRPDRSIHELVETYRPRQLELLTLLRDDGELTNGEFVLLQGYLAERAAPPPAEPIPTDRPIAAAPLAQDRTPITPRPLDEILRLYRIESLKQAGAVRARRQISYEEYMALKRHFGAAETAPPSDAPA